MQFFILVLLICLFVFLYSVYLLANDDFIFLRRDLTMEKVFNIIFVSSLISFFFSRLFFGLFHSSNVFANPIVFLLFPYFPGLSLLGGVVGGGAVFLFLATRAKNSLPLERLFDFLSIAFLVTLPVGYLGYFMLSEDGFSVVKASSMIIVYFVLFILFLKFLLPQLLGGKLKEGTITLVFVIGFSITSLIGDAFPKITVLDYFKNIENLILIAAFLASTTFLIRYEDLIAKIKDRGKNNKS